MCHMIYYYKLPEDSKIVQRKYFLFSVSDDVSKEMKAAKVPDHW